MARASALRIAAIEASTALDVDRTLAVSVARFTVASVTPGTLRNAFSTRATQDAHVIPST